MADSRFLDAAIAEGLGLAEWVKRKRPDKPELAVIRPATHGTHKGFFPAGQICEVFDGRFGNWKTSITTTKSGKAFLGRIIRRLSGQGDFFEA